MNVTSSLAGPVPGAPIGPIFLRTHRSRSHQQDAGWLWHGYLSPGVITLLSGRNKVGKTTLVSVLLARLESGGELAGRLVRTGRAVVVSEEDESLWEKRRLSFGSHFGVVCRLLPRRAKADDW